MGGGKNLLFTGGTLLINIVILAIFSSFLFISAILTSILAHEISDVDELIAAHRWAIGMAVVLWMAWAGLVFFVFVGFWILPWLFGLPYLAGAIFIVLGIFNLILMGILFYIAYAVRSSKAYETKTPEKVKNGFGLAIFSAIFVLLAAIGLIGYAVFIIFKYKKEGGITGTVQGAVQYGGQAAQFIAENPELLA